MYRCLVLTRHLFLLDQNQIDSSEGQVENERLLFLLRKREASFYPAQMTGFPVRNWADFLFLFWSDCVKSE